MITRRFKKETVPTQRAQAAQLFHVGVRAHPVKRPRVRLDQSRAYVSRCARLANPTHLITGFGNQPR